MGELIQLPPHTYRAKLFESPWETTCFPLTGTLDGFIDFAMPQGGTYPLSLDEARCLVVALNASIADVKENCLYGRDSLSITDGP